MKNEPTVSELFKQLEKFVTTKYEAKILKECEKTLKSLMDLPNEKWCGVTDFEEMYKVSTRGRIKSSHFGKETILKPQGSKDDYLKVSLRKDGRTKLVDIHILVAKAFIPNPENKPVVHHKDGNKHNNCVENLEWVTYGENNNYTYQDGAKKRILTADIVRIIRKSYIPKHPEFGIRALAKRFNVKEGLVRQVVHNITYKDVDCDCAGVTAAEPTMADIGICASTDILAVDQACADMVYAAHDSHDLKERIETRAGLRQLSAMAEAKLGNPQYEIIEID